MPKWGNWEMRMVMEPKSYGGETKFSRDLCLYHSLI